MLVRITAGMSGCTRSAHPGSRDSGALSCSLRTCCSRPWQERKFSHISAAVPFVFRFFEFLLEFLSTRWTTLCLSATHTRSISVCALSPPSQKARFLAAAAVPTTTPGSSERSTAAAYVQQQTTLSTAVASDKLGPHAQTKRLQKFQGTSLFRWRACAAKGPSAAIARAEPLLRLPASHDTSNNCRRVEL